MKDEVKNGIIISVCVVIIIVLVYFMTAVFMTGEIGGNNKKEAEDTSTMEKEDPNTSSSLSESYNNMIIASKTFNMSDEKYMVLFFSKKNASDSVKSALSSYDSGTHDVKLYKVNVDEVINSYVISDSENPIPTSSKDLKIKENALITISSGKVSSYLTKETDIINALK